MPSQPDPFQGQRYRPLKRSCLGQQSLFEDPEFPAARSSLFYHRAPPDGLSWKRPGELCSDPRLFVDGISPRDLHQGSLGNCWFVAAASCLASEPAVWRKVIPNPHEQDWDPRRPQSYCGIFRFRFWRWGHWTEVCVDDRLPCQHGKLLFCHSAEPREFWSALLEKAYAKLNGCYEALEGGNTAEALVDFTGGISELLALEEGAAGTDPEKQKQLFKQLRKAHSRAALISSSIRPLPGEGPEAQLSCGLVRGHAYGVTAVRTVHLRRGLLELFKAQKLQLIRLRNPWGSMEWDGAWSDKSPEWQQVSRRERHRMGVTVQDDGEFWMSFEDFCTHFTDVVICQRMNTARLSCQQRWIEGLRFGEWDPQKGLAGGCLNHQDSFLHNPQFFFEVPQAQASVLISLQQMDRRRLRGSGSGGRNIPMGFELFHVEQNRTWRLHQIPPRVAGSTYIDSRSIVLRVDLSGGRYALLPTTFVPGQRGAFLLRLYSERSAHLREISCNEPPTPSCRCCLGAPQLITSVWVQRAMGLAVPNSSKPPDVYVRVTSEGNAVRSRVHKAASSPDFDFKAIFCRRRPQKPIRIEVWARQFLRSTRLGYVKLLADTSTERGTAQLLRLEGPHQLCPNGCILVEILTSADLLSL
ncbi:calpain-5-like [Eublepharis macularius]|uniref:Calpain-5-like n=1 Tax=Eublepharis macularius TaxID=481883 RepID=A0AA97K409_EUBMA|nr:calpain-5-like [Eublepharis macularius]XP_054848414.1 calpain-5-like [Eublepharis macularius]XP_054848415.1 calpain-5-like [Eublepharis macularius]